MPRTSIPLCAVACVLQFSGPSPAAEPQLVQELTVQTTMKADSRLVTEIPAMVRTWTDQCTEKEQGAAADAEHCWRAAAAVASEYASGFSGPLVEQLDRLQVAWLRHASQLQAARLSQVDNEPQTAAATRPVRKKLRPETVQRARKVVAAAASNEATPAAQQRKKNFAAGKRPQKLVRSAKAGEVNVVPASHVSQDPRSGNPVATRAGAATRKAEMRAIQEELDRIAGRLDCLSRKCAKGMD